MKGPAVTHPFAPPVEIPFAHAYALVSRGERLVVEGDVQAIHGLASVTKLATAWSVLVAVERGLLTLADPAGPEGATIRHLLAHASGLPFESRHPQFPPERRRVYSNAGYEVLGDRVEDATGTPIGRWIEETVFEPLGMASAEVPASPAASGLGSVEDLLALGEEMLHPKLISTALADEARSIHYPELAGVVPGYGRFTPCPWGLGPEIRGAKSPHWTAPEAPPSTFGHFGVTGSFLWVDPVNEAVGAFLGERDFGPWHKENWTVLNSVLLTVAIG